MGINYREIGLRIKMRRRELKRTQDNLGEYLSVSVGYISQIERGATKVNLDTLSRIAEFLQCDIGELVTGTVFPTNYFSEAKLTALYGEMTREQRDLLLEMARIISKYPPPLP